MTKFKVGDRVTPKIDVGYTNCWTHGKGNGVNKYVKTDYVPYDEYPYLSVGVEYLVVEETLSGNGASIIDDTCSSILILYERCAHLDGESWTVIER